MRSASLGLILLLSACGAARGAQTHSVDPSADSSAGANVDPVLIRVVPEAGARYGTHTLARTDVQAETVLTEADGRLHVVSRDAVGNLELESRIDSIRLRNLAGAPVGSPGAYDLTGVVIRHRMDTRGTCVGEVLLEGTTASNAAFAETMRAGIQQGVVRLPERAVRVGERWSDTMSMTLPIEGSMLQFDCRADYTLAGIEHGSVAGEQLALLRFEIVCHGHAEMRGPEVVIPLDLDTVTRGEHHVALSDGISGVMTMETETTTTIHVHGERTETRMTQQVETRTSPALR